jgi:hypothetical protein
MMPLSMMAGVDSYALVQVPLFILAGELMNRGGLTQRLIDWALTLVGHLRGSLGHVSVLTNLVMAGVSGSAVADAVAIGKPLMPAQEIVDAKIGAADPVTLVPALFDAAVKAGPGLGMKEKPRLMKVGPFTGLKVDGDHATVKSGPRTMKIDKVGGKWLIDAPLPEVAPAQ